MKNNVKLFDTVEFTISRKHIRESDINYEKAIYNKELSPLLGEVVGLENINGKLRIIIYYKNISYNFSNFICLREEDIVDVKNEYLGFRDNICSAYCQNYSRGFCEFKTRKEFCISSNLKEADQQYYIGDNIILRRKLKNYYEILGIYLQLSYDFINTYFKIKDCKDNDIILFSNSFESSALFPSIVDTEFSNRKEKNL